MVFILAPVHGAGDIAPVNDTVGTGAMPSIVVLPLIGQIDVGRNPHFGIEVTSLFPPLVTQHTTMRVI